VTIVEYDHSKHDEWNLFVKSSKSPLFMFDRNFMEYHSDRFIDASLMFYQNDEVMAVLPATLHGDEVRSHGGLTYGGLICSPKIRQQQVLEIFQDLTSHLASKEIKSLLYKNIPYIFHRIPSQEDLYGLFISGARIEKVEPSCVIEFQPANGDSILKANRGRKAHISRARREGVSVENSEDFESFIALQNKVLMERHNTVAVHTAEELKLLHERFPDNIRCIVARYDSRIIAGTVLFIYDDTVHAQYLATDETGRRIGALDLVIWTLLEEYKQSKHFFDFGISTENGGLYLNEGLISQKESFGGRTVAYTTWRLDLQNEGCV